jgi:hypothetical protein
MLAAMLISSSAFGQVAHVPEPTIAPVSTGLWHHFLDINTAATYAALRLEQCSIHYECSSVIYIDPRGIFVVGPSRTDYQSDHVQIVASDGPSDWAIAANVHSHPCLPDYYTSVFSPQDMMGALLERTTSYMVDLCTGDVHEFIAGLTRTDTEKVGDVWMTGGLIVGHVPAIGYAAFANVGI